MLTKRTNILFSEQTWKELTALAKKQETSAAELIRNAVKESYFSDNDEKQKRIREAYESIIRNRKRVSGKLDYKALINEGRKI